MSILGEGEIGEVLQWDRFEKEIVDVNEPVAECELLDAVVDDLTCADSWLEADVSHEQVEPLQVGDDGTGLGEAGIGVEESKGRRVLQEVKRAGPGPAIVVRELPVRRAEGAGRR
eukprot:6093493-Heterocapsa_arctica.AAC.1